MAAAVPSFERATEGAKSSDGLDFLRRSPTKLLIGGKWVAPKSGKTFETINPAICFRRCKKRHEDRK
jgi:hypothetical protein